MAAYDSFQFERVPSLCAVTWFALISTTLPGRIWPVRQSMNSTGVATGYLLFLRRGQSRMGCMCACPTTWGLTSEGKA